MRRAVGVILLMAAMLATGRAPLFGQNPLTGNGNANAAERSKDRPVSGPPTLEKMTLPPGGVVVVVEEIKNALQLLPKMVLLAPAEYQKMLERLSILEKQLKAEKKAAHACKLTGRVDGDFATVRAEILFTTEEPKTSIFLGFLGAQFTDEGQLDGQVPFLDFSDDGFFVRAEKPGIHQLVVNLKLPVYFKRAALAAGGGEHGFDLGLPGAAVTTLALELPPSVKEIRCNDVLEKPRRPSRWELAVGKVKALAVTWKEPLAVPGNAPLLTADSQITVKVEDEHVSLNADMTLEDQRGQAKEWRLLLPPNAKIEVKAAANVGFDLLYPDAARPYHAIRLAEASGERLAVNVRTRQPRSSTSAHVAVGPFYVLGALRQEGVITVLASRQALHGQRLLFHPLGDVFPRDVPKGPAGADVAGVFKFWTSVESAKAAALKVPLELEFTADKSLAEAGIDHSVQMKRAKKGWLLEVTTTIQLKSRPDFLDVRLPRLPVPRLGLLGLAPGYPVLTALPWLKQPAESARDALEAMPLDFTCDDDTVKLGLPDSGRIARITWNRFMGNEIKVIGKYRVPEGGDHVHVELMRPIKVIDRGAKARIKVPEQLELRAAGSEYPLLDKHEARITWDTFPESMDFAWRPYRAPLPVEGVADIWLHDRYAEASQKLGFIVPARPAGGGPMPLRFRVPAAIKEVTVTSGGKLMVHDAAKESAWILPAGEPLSRAEIGLHYEFALPKQDGSAPAPVRQLVHVPLVWPADMTKEDAKVRIWTEPGTNAVLAETPGADEAWQNHGIEVVPGTEILPALVVRGAVINVPLTLHLLAATAPAPATMLCDRSLIQVAVDNERNQVYHARYWIQKLNARQLEVKLPTAAVDCLVNVWLDQKRITNWTPLERDPTKARIPIRPKLYQQPCMLEVEYKLPGGFASSASSWRTLLYAPRFQGQAMLGNTRWHVFLPLSRVGLVAFGNPEYHWGIEGGLLEPQAVLTTAETDSWRDASAAALTISLVFTQSDQENVQILEVPRQLWLLICSSAVLMIGLAVFVVPLHRWIFWLVVAGLASVIGTISLLWSGVIAPVVFGCEPGIVVLTLILAAQWMLQERYRRRLLFMPGFRRLKGDSSLTRSAASQRREPSTIDAPSPAASSSAPINHGLTKGS